ncbi:MAG TPA: hypothetical protein VHH36_00875 [Candidatus Thermoplasmatota archaeon]|nr:hypothetical protein [Candidatus Thermoplasmatota archaeon]
MALADALAVASGVLVLSFGLTVLLSGFFTSYFGAGKSRKIGLGLILIGLLVLFFWTTITFDVNIFGGASAWTADEMLTGIAAVVAGGVGTMVALVLFLVAIMRA